MRGTQASRYDSLGVRSKKDVQVGCDDVVVEMILSSSSPRVELTSTIGWMSRGVDTSQAARFFIGDSWISPS